MSNRSGAKWTVVAVVGVLAAVVAILAFVRDRTGADTTRSRTVDAPGAAGAPAGTGDPLETAASEASRAAETTASSDASLGKGVLRLAFVGEADGAAVADLPFVVRREREEPTELARGTSDAKGRAEVRDLDAGLILVETPRHPPYAKHVAACDLDKGRATELVVRLDTGARVSGRVVDDLGKPVEGADVLSDSDFGLGSTRRNALEDGTVAARTGSDGRFEVDHVADTPSGIQIVAGEARPERWLSATITVRKDLAAASASAPVKPGASIDIGDVVLVRTSTVAGVLLDSDGRPVDGALVSTRGDRFVARELDARAASPIAEELRPERGEVSTGPAGKFELRLGAARSAVAVWTPSGQRQVFALPPIAPGDRLDDLVLRLEAMHVLAIELQDERGQRILGPGPAARDPGVQIFSRKTFEASVAQAEAALELDDGTGESQGTAVGKDGLFRFRCKSSLARVRGLTIRMAGYEPLSERIANGLAREAPLTCTLKETPPLRFRLRRSSPRSVDDGSTSSPVQVWAQICLATPEQRRGSRLETLRCCGLGAAIRFAWSGEDKSFTLPAAGGRSFRLYLVGFDRGYVDVASFGPFDPGDEVHELAVDPESLRSGTDPTASAETPPVAKEPGEGEKRGKLSFRLVDAKTGDPVAGGQAKGEPMDAEAKKARWPFMVTDGEGKPLAKTFPAGSWTITFAGEGYRDAQRTGVAVRPYEETDLGMIALEPIPGFRGRVFDADGEPAPEGTWIQVRRRGGDQALVESGMTDEEGRFVVRTDVASDAWLEVYEASESSDSLGRAGQRLPATGWNADEERVFRLAPWQRVEVRISGAAADPPGSQLSLSACPAPGEPTATCDHRAGVPPGHGRMLAGNEVISDSSRRVFRFRMAPGRYQVYGTGLLHEVPVQVIEVKDSGDVQVFDLDSR